MSVTIEEVVSGLNLSKTVLLFGAGASIPSGAPSTAKVIQKIEEDYKVRSGYTLTEISGIVESKPDRSRLIKLLRGMMQNVRPTGGLRNIPLFPWKSIFTTNYDQLVEKAYELAGKTCRVYSSNFDFKIEEEEASVDFFKIHGTIDKDVSDGHQSRIIITDNDYERTEEYREKLYDRLKSDLSASHLLIIGQSLADPDIRSIVNRAAKLNTEAMQTGRITLFMYEADEDRAGIYESRGIKVAFGSIDTFSAALTSLHHSSSTTKAPALKPLTPIDKVRPVTIEVTDVMDIRRADLSKMASGWPATYADVAAGLTFQRSLVTEIFKFFAQDDTLAATLLGAAGVGKSTTVRQLLIEVQKTGAVAYEHKGDHGLPAAAWREVAAGLRKEKRAGILFIDDGHHHLQKINELLDGLASDNNMHLKIVIASTRNHWEPRVKSANIFKHGKSFRLSRLAEEEIEQLLGLIDMNPSVRELAERDFKGFSREERRRRLTQRCGADMFVCLKNIFAVESFDDIILRDFSELDPMYQDIYRYVAAMETAGIHVHRQLVIRLLGIDPMSVGGTLAGLRDIVSEYDIDVKKHIYGWRCRHAVISGIVTKYKFPDIDKTIELFDDVIDNLSPTYDIEIRTLRELCNIETGLARITDRNEQNRLLRKMISVAPAERVPRHRLIRNLIGQGAFDKADTEIKLFISDFGADGPVHRYRIRLMVARAIYTTGIMTEDRIAILKQAASLSVSILERFSNNKSILAAYAEVGVEYYKLSASFEYFYDAIEKLKLAEDRLGDPDISAIIRRLEQRVASHSNWGMEEIGEEVDG